MRLNVNLRSLPSVLWGVERIGYSNGTRDVNAYLCERIDHHQLLDAAKNVDPSLRRVYATKISATIIGCYSICVVRRDVHASECPW